MALGATTSPATMLGLLATLPLQHGARELLAALGVAVALAAGWLGLRRLGGLSLEAARRRATLAAEMRFSASVQDVRTVILLRRQLASEKPRRRPWLRLRAPRLARRPVWRRGWQSLLRWPAARLVRVLLAGAAAGAVAVAGLGRGDAAARAARPDPLRRRPRPGRAARPGGRPPAAP